MLFLIHGNEIQKRRAYSDKLLKALIQKRPSSLIIERDLDTFSIFELDEAVSSVGLFDEKNIFVLRGLLEDEVVWKYVLENLAPLQSSDHAFIFVDTTVSKKLLDKALDQNVTITSFTKEEKKEVFDVFSITNELSSRNIPKTWFLIKQAQSQGVALEEIVSILLWQLKSIQIARTHLEQDSGLKPFVYKKSKSSALSQTEVSVLYKSFIIALHEYKRGGTPLELVVEKELLSL